MKNTSRIYIFNDLANGLKILDGSQLIIDSHNTDQDCIHIHGRFKLIQVDESFIINTEDHHVYVMAFIKSKNIKH